MIDLIACFFAGAFLINSLPHLANGLSGRAFPTPFARRRGRAESSSTLNVLWGAFNLAAGCSLAGVPSGGDRHSPLHIAAFAVGGLLLGLFLARRFGARYGGNSPTPPMG